MPHTAFMQDYRVDTVPAQSPLTYVRDFRTPDESRQAYARAALRGEMVRVARGVYSPTARWSRLSPRGRYVERVQAIAGTRKRSVVFSHWSAAALQGLPVIGGCPNEVHTIVGTTSGGRSRHGMIRHSLRLDDEDVVEIDGLLMTSVARTALDLAVSSSFLSAVATADEVIHIDRFRRKQPLATPEELWELWNRALPFRGHARAREVFGFMNGQSGSVEESASRVNMHVAGFPAPRLQTRFDDYQGFIAYVDFDWEDHLLVGEADGKGKYTDPQLMNGLSAEEILYSEKCREDRLRAIGRQVSRWDWQIAVSPHALRRHLLAAGLPLVR